ncbi:MAG: polyhydroxyalkanoate synthesis regulator DNA-binding domain-containing protein [Gammaproteobacteria bacterium]
MIRKYSNRRLFDTGAHRYITFADLRRLVADRKGFQILDSSGIDITRTSLLQAVVEHEQSAGGVFTLEFLKHLIACQEGERADSLRSHLNECLRGWMSDVN